MEKMVLPGLRLRRPDRPGHRSRSRSSEAPDAYERFQAGGKLGKIVLDI